MKDVIFSQKYFNSPNESNPEGELALNILVSNIIETATAHANSLGIGNPVMSHLGAGWVLSRLALEMTAYPECNSCYTLNTWVEGWNRHYSTRCFSFEDKDGNVIGYARSVWMVLDMNSHDNFGLSHLLLPEGSVLDKECPIAPQSKHTDILPMDTPADEVSAKALRANAPTEYYNVKYNDIDFYRHINTVRYVTMLLNRYSLDEFDAKFVKRLELSFLHEGSFGDTIRITRHNFSKEESAFSLFSEKAQRPVVFARLILRPRS